ncbi:oligosaccharide flippase family protein [Enterococcus pseudoavium]|uniref:oligosaccharide flippase family protein n=1 Tax=Enterococcus pseudoavium TaxID=44007 RepID=UPI0028911444|nr:oligosaccharide flippase family protein [Enterococcus pseudoavium]MDT2753534.1 oligosaccharide flippase family protein [Enterococcus pseudoavium]
MKKTVHNFVYQSIFQLVKIILPIVTIPIVSNALGPYGIGVYNYTNSIAQYFVLIAGLGVGVYGNREIARIRDDDEKLSQKFWELFSMSFLISFISLILYLVVVSFSKERFYFYLQAIVIVAAVFDISWFFMGIEDFKKTSLSSLAAQLISFLAILFFVKEKSDLWIYILIQSMNILISQGFMWIFIWEKITFVRIKIRDMAQHILPSLQYFIPKVAIILYTNLNKTLLGWLDTKDAVGFFSNTLLMNGILVTLVTTLDMVLLPKFSNLVAKGHVQEILKTMKKTITLQLFFTIPMMFGILIVTPKLVPWFFGPEFLLLIKTIPMVSPLIIIMPLGMAVGRQYLVPMNRITVYNKAVIYGAIVSVIANLILIPYIGIYGAIIATLLAETFVTLTRFFAFKKETNISLGYKNIILCVLAGIIMYVVTSYVTNPLSSSMITTVIQGILGVVIYMIATMVFKVNPIYDLLTKKKMEA